MPQPNAVKCLVVDDEPRLRRVLVRLLEGEGFSCAEAGSGTEALEMLQQDPVPLVISDLRMPQMDGVTLLREIIARWPTTAVIVVTAVAEVESAVACLQLGALDYVAKPFHLDEVRARVMQALDKRRLILENRMYHHQLEERVQEQAHRIEELSLERLQALVHFLEEKDPYTRGHSVRVANYALGIGRQLQLDREVIDMIALGAELHDIGKIGVSEAVLHKAGRLSDAEYRHIMEHPVIGARILAPLLRDVPAALAIVRSHHERLDGKGLPDGLTGDDIPLEVRVVTVADSFDAMTSVRPYRPALSVQRAMQELEDMQSVQFDPRAVAAFLDAFPDRAAPGCDVIDLGLVPTPTVQLAVEHHQAGGGIVITASHNPIEWNALKFIGPDGIFLDGPDGARVQQLAVETTVTGRERTVKGRGRGKGEAQEIRSDPRAVERHLDAVLELPAVDVDRIRRRQFKVALDAVRGAGGPVMRVLLERLGCSVTGINLETDGQFPRAPEPVPENLGELSALVRRSGADLGIAVDPDVDRLAMVDETGAAIGEDYTLAFAVRAVVGEGGRGKGQTGVCNLSTSLVVEDAARALGAEIVRTPVGEVHVARAILRLAAVIGGEGNGGVMYPALDAGRDAPVATALVLELLARTQQTVSELVKAGPRYTIVKAKTPRGPALEPVYMALRQRFADAQVDTQDGLRLAWRDRWLHVRPSNTEPIVRLIAEAPTSVAARQLVDEGRRLCAAS